MDSDIAVANAGESSFDVPSEHNEEADAPAEHSSTFPSVRPFYSDAASQSVDPYKRYVADTEVDMPSFASLIEINGSYEWIVPPNEASNGLQKIGPDRGERLGPDGQCYDPGDQVYFCHPAEGIDFVGGTVTDEPTHVLEGHRSVRVHFMSNIRSPSVNLQALRATYIPIVWLRSCYEEPRIKEMGYSLNKVMDNGWTMHDVLKLKPKESVVTVDNTFYCVMLINPEDYSIYMDELKDNGERVFPIGHSSLFYIEDLDMRSAQRQAHCLRLEKTLRKFNTQLHQIEMRKQRETTAARRQAIKDTVLTRSPGIEKLLKAEQAKLDADPKTVESLREAYLLQSSTSALPEPPEAVDFDLDALRAPTDQNASVTPSHSESGATERANGRRTHNTRGAARGIRLSDVAEEAALGGPVEEEQEEQQEELPTRQSSKKTSRPPSAAKIDLDKEVKEMRRELKEKYNLPTQANMREFCREILEVRERNEILQQLLEDVRGQERVAVEELHQFRNRTINAERERREAEEELQDWKTKAESLLQRDRRHDDEFVRTLQGQITRMREDSKTAIRALNENLSLMSEQAINNQDLMAVFETLGKEFQGIAGVSVRVARLPKSQPQFLETPLTDLQFLGDTRPPRIEDPNKYISEVTVTRNPDAETEENRSGPPTTQPTRPRSPSEPQTSGGANINPIPTSQGSSRKRPDPPASAFGPGRTMDFTSSRGTAFRDPFAPPRPKTPRHEDDDVIFEQMVPPRQPTPPRPKITGPGSARAPTASSKPSDAFGAALTNKLQAEKRRSQSVRVGQTTIEQEAIRKMRKAFQREPHPLLVFKQRPSKHYFSYTLSQETVKEILEVLKILEGHDRAAKQQLFAKARAEAPTPELNWNDINWTREQWFKEAFVGAKLLLASEECGQACTGGDFLEPLFWITWFNPEFDFKVVFRKKQEVLRYLESIRDVLNTYRGQAIPHTPTEFVLDAKTAARVEPSPKTAATNFLAQVRPKPQSGSDASSLAGTPNVTPPRRSELTRQQSSVPSGRPPKPKPIQRPTPVVARQAGAARSNVRKAQSEETFHRETNINEYELYRNMFNSVEGELRKSCVKIAKAQPKDRTRHLLTMLTKFMTLIIEKNLLHGTPTESLTFLELCQSVKAMEKLIEGAGPNSEETIVQMRRIAWISALFEKWRELSKECLAPITNRLFVNIVRNICAAGQKKSYQWEHTFEMRKVCVAFGVRTTTLKKATTARAIYARFYGFEADNKGGYPKIYDMMETVELEHRQPVMTPEDAVHTEFPNEPLQRRPNNPLLGGAGVGEQIEALQDPDGGELNDFLGEGLEDELAGDAQEFDDEPSTSTGQRPQRTEASAPNAELSDEDFF